MDKKTLEMLAKKLMFTMNDEEYETLSDEFETILKQMDLIGKIDGIKDVEPLIYPFPISNVNMREDKVVDELEIDDILKNSGDTLYNQVKVPKVVE
jgi:aspartyl-tRNA(Asn)/glutamyl-tRNA(Gln) amidotransferase subunit C